VAPFCTKTCFFFSVEFTLISPRLIRSFKITSSTSSRLLCSVLSLDLFLLLFFLLSLLLPVTDAFFELFFPLLIAFVGTTGADFPSTLRMRFFNALSASSASFASFFSSSCFFFFLTFVIKSFLHIVCCINFCCTVFR